MENPLKPTIDYVSTPSYYKIPGIILTKLIEVEDWLVIGKFVKYHSIDENSNAS